MLAAMHTHIEHILHHLGMVHFFTSKAQYCKLAQDRRLKDQSNTHLKAYPVLSKDRQVFLESPCILYHNKKLFFQHEVKEAEQVSQSPSCCHGHLRGGFIVMPVKTIVFSKSNLCFVIRWKAQQRAVALICDDTKNLRYSLKH
jgi:hypothetical protein